MASVYPTSRRRVDPLEILREASELVADYPLDVDELLRSLAELIRKVVDSQLIAVLLRSGGDTLKIRFAIGFSEELMRHLRVKVGEGITGAAAADRKTVIANDVTKDPRYLMAVDAVRSEIAVPLVARGKLVGVIDIQSPVPQAFGEYEQNMLELIASRFSLAIDGARLYRATLRQNRTLRTLSQIAQEFTQILDLEELLTKISLLVRELIPYDAFSIYLVEADRGLLKNYFGVRFHERTQWANLPLGQGIVGAVAESGEPIYVRDTQREPRYVAAVEGIRSEMAVPLILKDRVMGVLDLESTQVGAFNPSHERTLSLLAPQVATAIENARLYEQVRRNEERLALDLEAARELQTHVLATIPPEFEGVELAARDDSASEVTGDLFDFYPFPEGWLGILTGDVSGKGAAAALYGALVHGLLGNLVRAHHEPKELLAAANRALRGKHAEPRYLTALYALWRPAEHKLSIANAGHPWPIVCRRGRAEAVSIAGLPLGMFDDAEHESAELVLDPGDVLLIASDGLTESENDQQQPYGEQRLREAVEVHHRLCARELLDAVFADVVPPSP